MYGFLVWMIRATDYTKSPMHTCASNNSKYEVELLINYQTQFQISTLINMQKQKKKKIEYSPYPYHNILMMSSFFPSCWSMGIMWDGPSFIKYPDTDLRVNGQET